MSPTPNSETLLEQAALLAGSGNFQEAITAYEALLRVDPYHVIALNNFGIALKATGQSSLAQTAFEKAIAIEPSMAELHHNLGEVLQLQKRNTEAIEAYSQAARLNPNLLHSRNNLGYMLLLDDRVDEAIECLTQVLAVSQEFVDATYNLGLAYQAKNQHELALQCFQSLSATLGYDASLWLRIGMSLHQTFAFDQAIAACQKSIQLGPANAQAHYVIGTIYHDCGKIEEAVDNFLEANRLRPGGCTATLVNELQHACRWDLLPEYTRVLKNELAEERPPNHANSSSLAIPIDPFIVVTLAEPSTTEQQAIAAGRMARWVQSHVADRVVDPQAIPERRGSQRLRIGYLSSDFCEHATAYLIAELFQHHDRSRFEVAAYSCGSDDPSPIRNKIIANVDSFVDLHQLSNRRAAEKIANDKVDILIDLKGYTQGARPEILAYRPAPVQIHYLGYPGPLNADFIDAILVDKYIVPRELQSDYREKLVYLDGCYQANLALDPNARVIAPSRESQGLPPSGFVFCAFHSSYKITPRMFDVWMRLLRDVEGSVLWLLDSNTTSVGNLKREAQHRGLDIRRLVFAPRCSHESHLSRLQLADLFLDTFPVNAHTTAGDALRQGVPMITLSGDTLVSRVAGSLLSHIGFNDWITHAYAEYEMRARSLATDREKGAAMRERLEIQIRRSDLFQPAAMARKLEKALQAIWDDYLSGVTS